MLILSKCHESKENTVIWVKAADHIINPLRWYVCEKGMIFGCSIAWNIYPDRTVWYDKRDFVLFHDVDIT